MGRLINLFKRFLFKKYRLHSILGPIFKIFEAVFELLVPFVIKYMIDSGVNNGSLTDNEKIALLWKCGGLLLAFAVIGICMTLVCQWLASRASQGMGTDLRDTLYAHINTLSFKELDELGTSSLITRMTADINNVQQAAAMTIRLLIRAPFIVIGATILSFMISWQAGLVFVLTSIALFALLFGIMFYTIPNNKRAQKKLDDVTQITKENLSGNRVVRAFNKQKYEFKRFVDSQEELTDIQIKVGKINALLSPMTFLIVNVASIAVLFLAGKSFSVGDLTQGEIQALINYLTQIQVAVVALTGLIVLLTKASASASRINAVFAVESSIKYGDKDTCDDVEDVIVFDNVTFKYNENSKPAIENISFNIKRNETVGIIGGTGSGKSTIVNLMNRFYDTTDGKVLLYGTDVRDYKNGIVNSKISTVMQKAVLFRGTVKDNLLNGKKDATEEEINKALEISQAKEFVYSKKDGLNEEIYQGGKNLSGGQRQRLSIARAIIKDSDVIILDDSSSALDFKTELALRQGIKTLNKTTVIISQRASSIMHANKILVMDNGKVVGTGTHEELIKACDVYREICDSQGMEVA